jgi:hypothetical protein
MKSSLRSLRGWFYRNIPSWNRYYHGKRLAGLERRWALETKGFTKEGFVRILKKRFLRGALKGHWLELRAGDGLVGSLGTWLESLGSGWVVEAWENRPIPLQQLRMARLRTRIEDGRLTDWKVRRNHDIPDGISTRGVREASAVCRAVRQNGLRPRWIGIWNPSRRSLWAQRFEASGYKLELAWHNMEFYRRRSA